MKGAMQSALSAAPVKVSAIAEELGLAPSTLYNYCNEHIPEQQLTLRLFVPFCRATGSIEPLQFMARQLGAVCCRLPEVSGAPLKDIERGMLDAVKEVGEAIGAYEAATDMSGEHGKRVTANEKNRLALAVEEVLIAVLKVQKKVESLKAE